METLLRIGLSNALMATVFAVLVAAFSRICRRPAVIHSLWLLVLLKLLTPPFWNIPLAWPDRWQSATPVADSSRLPIEPPVMPHSPTDGVSLAAETGTNTVADEEAISSGRWVARPESSKGVLAAESRPSKTQGVPPTKRTMIGLQANSVSIDMPNPSAPETQGMLPEISWLLLVVVIWLTGSAFWFALTAFRVSRFNRQLRYAQPAPQKVREQVRGLAGHFGLAQGPSVWLVPGRLSPLLYALGRSARLFVPAALWQRLTEDQQLTLLAHELAHLRRRDQWVRGLELLVTGLYWWHPVVWWACREIREAEEQCCDAWVVWALPRTARAYATALLETVDFLSETQTALPVAASGIGQVHDLRRRLTMIMRGTTPRALSSAGFLAVLGLGALLLPLVPSWAQQVPADREQDPLALPGDASDAERSQLWQLEKTAKQVADMEAKVKQAQAQLEQSMAQFQRAKARLDKMKQDLEARNRAETKVSTRDPEDKVTSPRTESGSPPDLAHRLTAVEKKLDTLLSEVRSLRRELRRSNPDARFAPGRPGMGGMPGMMPGGPGGPMMAPGALPGVQGPAGGLRAPGAGQHAPGQPGPGSGGETLGPSPTLPPAPAAPSAPAADPTPGTLGPSHTPPPAPAAPSVPASDDDNQPTKNEKPSRP